MSPKRKSPPLHDADLYECPVGSGVFRVLTAAETIAMAQAKTGFKAKYEQRRQQLIADQRIAAAKAEFDQIANMPLARLFGELGFLLARRVASR